MAPRGPRRRLFWCPAPRAPRHDNPARIADGAVRVSSSLPTPYPCPPTAGSGIARMQRSSVGARLDRGVAPTPAPRSAPTGVSTAAARRQRSVADGASGLTLSSRAVVNPGTPASHGGRPSDEGDGGPAAATDGSGVCGPIVGSKVICPPFGP